MICPVFVSQLIKYYGLEGKIRRIFEAKNSIPGNNFFKANKGLILSYFKIFVAYSKIISKSANFI